MNSMATKAEGNENFQSISNPYSGLANMEHPIMPPINAMYMDPKFNPGLTHNYDIDQQPHIPDIPKVKSKKPKKVVKAKTKQVPLDQSEPKAPVKRRGKGAGPGGSVTTNYKRCCCSPGCNHARVNNRQVCSLYAFPNGQPFRNLWIRALEVHASPWYKERLTNMPLSHLFLCSCHFDKPPDPKSRRPDLKYVMPTIFTPPPPGEDPEHEWAQGDGGTGTEISHLKAVAQEALEMPYKDFDNIPHALYNEIVSKTTTGKDTQASQQRSTLEPGSNFSILRNMITKNFYPPHHNLTGAPESMQEYSSNKQLTESFQGSNASTASSYPLPSKASKPPNNSTYCESSNMWESAHIKDEPIDEGYEQSDKRETSTITPNSDKSVTKKGNNKQEGRVKRKYTKKKKVPTAILR